MSVRLGAFIAAIACCLGWPAAALGAGGTYEVVQCDPLNREHTATTSGSSAYVTRDRCVQASESNSLKIENARSAGPGQGRRFVWAVPEGLGLVGVRVQARMRRNRGHIPRLYMANAAGKETVRIATGGTDDEGFRTINWSGPSQKRLVASLACEGNERCRESDKAKTWVRNVRLEVVDLVDPEVEVGGSLLGGGWLRGSAHLATEVWDVGSGVRLVSASVGGVEVLTRAVICEGAIVGSDFAARLVPCPSVVAADRVLDTTVPPWANGLNELKSCGYDLGRNSGCITRIVRIDNEAPQLAFNPNQSVDDPELIQVTVLELHSGLASGSIQYRKASSDAWETLPTQMIASELRARVDSAAVEPGTYEFKAEVADVAGNSAETTLREDGLPMTLEFPLRSGVKLTTRLAPGGARNRVVDYGRSLSTAGRLLSAAGKPLANQPVVVEEYFGEGALIDRRVRTVFTNDNGRWSSKNPAGPSRRITASYAGDARYLGAAERVGRMSVRTGARFGVTRARVREGKRVTFKGRVGRLGARIPDRGKLVQLQYQDADSGRWSTVRNPFYTNSRGRYRFSYKFGTHYVTDVGIRFRLRVLPEQAWPYRSVKTRARRVVVEAR